MKGRPQVLVLRNSADIATVFLGGLDVWMFARATLNQEFGSEGHHIGQTVNTHSKDKKK